MGAGQLWLAQITAGASYPAAVLPGLVLTAAGVGLALPTASIAITSGVRASDQGLAGALFTTSQQTGAAVGLAILATAAAAATAGHGGSLADGYRLSFLIAAGLAVLAAIIVALQLSSKSHRVEPRPGVDHRADRGSHDPRGPVRRGPAGGARRLSALSARGVTDMSSPPDAPTPDRRPGPGGP
jgi:MFS family permease